jgi:hypothetical protein
MRDKYEAECSAIEQNCKYTAETHHIIAAKQKRLGNLFQIAPAVIAAVLGALAGTDLLAPWMPKAVTPFTQWLSVVSAAIAAVSNVLNPFAAYYDHLRAAKGFTILKQDARALRDTFSISMSDDTLAAATRFLHDRYADLVRSAPETDNKSFNEGRRRVKEGLHDLD